MKYLEAILQKDPNVLLNLNEFQKNDRVGRPRTYNFPVVGKMSPTTLRYIAVAVEIAEKIGKSKFSKIVEIGGGYGGQASILRALKFYEEYYVYDLPNVQVLIEKFCSSQKVKNMVFPDLTQSYNYEFDLLISNYAFSELPRNVQNQYIEKVILKSRNGFMIMNSGYSNRTGRSDGKISVSELQTIIPNLEMYPEEPLTSPDNYLLVWRQNDE
jgi:putative sugar O-methyltransferase